MSFFSKEIQLPRTSCQCCTLTSPSRKNQGVIGMNIIGTIQEKEELKKFKRANWVLNILYLLLGGIYISSRPDVSKLYKSSWIFSNILTLSIFFIAALIYFVISQFHKSLTVFDAITVTLNISIVIQIVILIPCITVYYRLGLSNMFKYIKKSKKSLKPLACKADFPTTRMSENIFLKKSNPVAIPLGLLAITTLLCLIYMIAPGLVNVWRGNERPVELKDHILLIPFYDRVPSSDIYYLIYSFEIILGFTLNVAGSIHPTFFLILYTQLYNHMVDYCNKIHRLSQIVEQKIRSNDGRLDDTLREDFEKDLKTLVKEYMEFKKSLKSIRTYTNIFFSFMVFTTAITQLCNVYFMFEATLDISMKVKQICFTICVLFYLIIICYIGKMFEDMGESIRYEVYNLPWYKMPSRTRRIISIFQSTVFKHIEFKVFVVTLVSMALFPKVMQAVYSYFNIVRTAVRRERHSSQF